MQVDGCYRFLAAREWIHQQKNVFYIFTLVYTQGHNFSQLHLKNNLPTHMQKCNTYTFVEGFSNWLLLHLLLWLIRPSVLGIISIVLITIIFYLRLAGKAPLGRGWSFGSFLPEFGSAFSECLRGCVISRHITMK